MTQIDRKRARSSKKAVRRKARRQVSGAAPLVIVLPIEVVLLSARWIVLELVEFDCITCMYLSFD